MVKGWEERLREVHAFIREQETSPSLVFPAETFRFKTRRISLYENGKRIEWDLVRNRKELFETDADMLEVTNVARKDKDSVKALATRAEEVFGKPWVAKQDGKVEVSKGVVLNNGARRSSRVKSGDSFQVLPYDAATQFTPTDSTEAAGPWRSTSPPAADAAIEYRAETKTAGIELDDATRKMLEQLGYMQGDGEE